MNAEKSFEKYIAQGPDALTLDETKQTLEWSDSHPAEALANSRQHEARAREADDREGLRATWLLQGGDPSTFEANFKLLRQEHEAAKLAEMENEARVASWRDWKDF
jgi:hypothetical protein